MKSSNYFRGLVVAPFAILPVLILVTLALRENTLHVLHEFMFWLGGPLFLITIISTFIYIPTYMATWKWFSETNEVSLIRKIWLFPIPCLLTTAVLMFSILLPESAVSSIAVVAGVSYGYITIGVLLYFVLKRIGFVQYVT